MGRLTAAGLPLSFAAVMARDTWPSGRLARGNHRDRNRGEDLTHDVSTYAARVGERLRAVRNLAGLCQEDVVDGCRREVHGRGA